MITGLRSAKLKLARAAKHLRAIKRSIAVYSASQPHKIVAKAKGKKKLNIPKPPPREISILAGEMVYQMRSALDHLAFNLVKLNPSGMTLATDWEEHCFFPLRLKLPKKTSAYNCFERILPGITKPAFAFIESVQPYHGPGAIHRCLRFLAQLSNVDKHRYLNIISPRVEKSECIRFASGLRSSTREALNSGAEIHTVSFWNQSDKAVHVHRRFRTSVYFNERLILGDAIIVPAQELLQFVLKQIKTIIIPAFDEFIKNP